MHSSANRVFIALIFYVFALFYISYWVEQHQFSPIFITYGISFLSFLYCFKHSNALTERNWYIVLLIIFCVPLFSAPSLSPDVYRFFWDGELVTNGIHPFRYLPKKVIQDNSIIHQSDYMQQLYHQMTDLSKKNYTVYPTFMQFFFLVVAAITQSTFTAFIVMRLLMIIVLLIGARYVKKLLKICELPSSNALFLMLNPIIVIETIGNFHFEAIMLSFLFIGIYYALRHKWVLSALFWALVINLKLTPLILLPFFLRFFGWKKSVPFYAYTSLFTVGLLIISVWPNSIAHFGQSLSLYFNNFEFNAGIFYASKWIFSGFTEQNPTLVIGPLLSIISFLTILFLAFYRSIDSPKEWLKRMMFGYIVLLLLSTTVHPWYIILPLGFAVFNTSISLLTWSFLIMLSYSFYSLGNSMWEFILIGIEYITFLFLLFLPENNTIIKKNKEWLKIDD